MSSASQPIPEPQRPVEPLGGPESLLVDLDGPSGSEADRETPPPSSSDPGSEEPGKASEDAWAEEAWEESELDERDGSEARFGQDSEAESDSLDEGDVSPAGTPVVEASPPSLIEANASHEPSPPSPDQDALFPDPAAEASKAAVEQPGPVVSGASARAEGAVVAEAGSESVGETGGLVDEQATRVEESDSAPRPDTEESWEEEWGEDGWEDAEAEAGEADGRDEGQVEATGDETVEESTEEPRPVEDPEGVLAWVRAVLKQSRRRAGTPAERLTAERLVKEMKALGLETSVETFKALRTSTWVSSVVLCLAAVCYGLVGWAPYISLALSCFALGLYVARLLGFSTPLVNLLPRGVSRSAAGVLPGTQDRQRRLYLSAHYDVGRIPSSLHRLVRGEGGPGYLLTALVLLGSPLLSTLGLIAMSEGLPLGLGIGCWLAAAWLVFVVLITVHFERKGALSAGAVTNASGVAAVLCAARSMLEEPPKSFEVVVLFPGAHESGGWGMRHAISTGAKPLGDYHVVVDSVGAGDLVCVTKAGFPLVRRFTGALPRVAQKLCTYREFRNVRETSYRQDFSDALVPAMAGRSTVAVMGLDEGGRVVHRHRSDDVLGAVDPARITGAAKYIEALVRALDEEMT